MAPEPARHLKGSLSERLVVAVMTDRGRVGKWAAAAARAFGDLVNWHRNLITP